MVHIYQSYTQLSIQLDSESGFSKRICFNGEDNTFCTTDEMTIQLLDENCHLGYYIKLEPPLSDKYAEKEFSQEEAKEDWIDEEVEESEHENETEGQADHQESQESQESQEEMHKEVPGLTTLAQIRDYLNKVHKVPFNRMKNADAIMQEAEELGITFTDYER